jgi:hypothetical protein
MSSFAKISIRFNADLKQFRSQMDNATRDIKKVGAAMTKVGAGLSAGLTLPLLALGAKSVQSFNKQAKAIAQVEAGLKSTGNAVGFTSQKLQDMASDLQNTTLFGDEEILQGATAQLLTFTNIAGVQFERTQKAALDLATRLDGDLKSASIQLGKALNDPVANLSALSRSGIQFSKEQKAVINSLVATNRLADAQTIILDELQNQYGGAAEAAAKAGTGPFTQLSNILGDILEDFGKIIAEALLPFIAKLKEMALSFKALSPEVKKTIVIVAALLSAIGPLLVTLGLLMTTVIPGLITAFAFLSTTAIPALITAFTYLNTVILANPITWVVAAVAALVYGFTELVQTITPAVSKLKTFYNLVASGGNYSSFVAMQLRDQMTEAAKATGDASVALNKLNNILSKPEETKTTNTPTLKLLPTDAEIKAEAAAAEKALNESLQATINRSQKELDKIQLMVAMDIDVAKNAAEVEYFINKIDDLNEAWLTLEDLPDPFEGFKDTMVDVGDTINSALEGAIQNTVQFFAEFIGALASGNASIGDLFKGLIGLVAGFMDTLGQALIAVGVASEAFKTVFASGVGAIIAGGALIALASVVKAIFAGGVGGSSGGRTAVPALANGGIAYGPTMAYVGEYAGANSNPEVIAPLDKLKAMIADTVGGGGGNMNVTGEFILKNNTLVAAVKRGDAFNKRRG